MSKLNKEIVYTISAKLRFDPEEPINIEEVLDTLRGIGEAEIIDVEVVLTKTDVPSKSKLGDRLRDKLAADEEEK